MRRWIFDFPRSGGALDPILRDLPRHSVAVQTEELGSIADAPFGPLQGARDEHLLELPARIVVQDPLVEHLLDEPVELISHVAY